MFKRIRNALIGFLGGGLIRLIGPTLRFEVRDASGLTSNAKKNPIVFAFWHNRMFLMPYLYHRFMPGRRGVCLVSASQDGEMIARVLQRFGLGVVRGSSSRRGREAYRGLVDSIQDGFDVGITPDGPRGPCYKVQVGVAGLASLSGAELVPLSWNVSWKVRLRSWDRFIIPLPFSRCTFDLGAPIRVESDEKVEESRLRLEETLKELAKD